MAKTPGFLADRVMAAAHPARLVRRDASGHGLLELVLGCDDFRTATFLPGDSTAFRVSRTEFRHYTPARLDTDRGELTIVVHRHGSGPGEELILGWEPGDEVPVCQWGHKKSFIWGDDGSPVVITGDATVISLVMAFADRCAAAGRDLLAVLEVHPGDVDATRAFVPDARVLAAGPDPGVALDNWLGLHADQIDPASTVYLAGHGQSIQRQRRTLLERTNLDRKQVKTQPYWATGKAGL